MRIIKKKEIIDTNIKVNLFALVFNSFFFIGFIPVASGTLASAFSLLPFLIKPFNDIFILILFIVIFFIISLFTGKSLIEKYGKDPSIYVMDEVIGMWLTMFVIRIFFSDILLTDFVIGFLSFRFFDIVKIQPSIYFDKLSTSFGILMDDVISGIYAGFASSLLIYIIKLIV